MDNSETDTKHLFLFLLVKEAESLTFTCYYDE